MKNINIPLLNSNYTYHVGKHYLMYGNLRSTLVGYENQTIHLNIAISKKWQKHPQQTALQIAQSWVNFSEELSDARRYIVKFSRMKQVGELEPSQYIIQGSLVSTSFHSSNN